uniref:Uncharacterized protein n=1 Tax=Avena sativa TaxID=4498 RepID=A0ACD5XSZ7_AVESA
MGEEVAQVVIAESGLVPPLSETPTGALWLSPLDLLKANRGHTPLLHFYRPSSSPAGGATDFFDVARLKAALGKALVAFYPLAGRLDVDQDGRLQIDCGGQGALLLVAHSSHLTVDDLSDFKPSPELKRQLVPGLDSDEAARIMCAIQVTFFKCGGVAVGTALHHLAMDGYGASHFFQTWSAFSRDGVRAVVELPFHDRALLSPRDPPFVRPDALSLLHPALNLSELSGDPVATEVFLLGKGHVSALKRICGGASTFSALSAHVWRCICLARRLPPGSTTRLVFPANVRRILTPPLPDRYFGNAVMVLAAASKTQDIIAGGLASVAGRIRGVIGRMDDELVRSAVDQLVLAKSDGRVAARGSLPLTDVRVISWLGMPLYDADFSWGKPVAVLRAESNRGGFVHLMDQGGDGGVRVVVCAETAILGDFKRLLYDNLLLHSML